MILRKIFSIHLFKPGLLLVMVALFLVSCNGKNPVSTNPGSNKKTNTNVQITAYPDTTFQTMVGFGGALTWYSNLYINSANKDTISKLLFKDMGTDIIRLKNWYYPKNYPTNKSTTTMNSPTTKQLFDDTNQIYSIAKKYDPNIKVLLSSWGPPAEMKSNDNLREGTLKKDSSGVFMYQAFANYWTDILNHISFNPDYISIQNEPTFVTNQWTTCKWSATELPSLPGYLKAFKMVHDQIKNRTNPPVMIGPESQDINTSFSGFADALKSLPYLGMYAYHIYNFNSNTEINQTTDLLKSIHTNYGNKPNMMTEYSGMSWFKTAELINNVVTKADASGYIYWEMVWDASSKYAMIGIDNSGNYTVTPFYYVMKHFAKYISAGYKRVAVTSSNSDFSVSGFINPSKNQMTLILINPLNMPKKMDLQVNGKSISKTMAIQSVNNNYYQKLSDVTSPKGITLPGQSITTVVVNI